MNVEYSYYTGTYGGSSITGSAWANLEQRAEQILMYHTFDRVKEAWDQMIVKNCVCQLAEYLQEQDKVNPNVSSENIDGYSVSYRSKEDMRAEEYEIIAVYLMNTGMLSFEVE